MTWISWGALIYRIPPVFRFVANTKLYTTFVGVKYMIIYIYVCAVSPCLNIKTSSLSTHHSTITQRGAIPVGDHIGKHCR